MHSADEGDLHQTIDPVECDTSDALVVDGGLESAYRSDHATGQVLAHLFADTLKFVEPNPLQSLAQIPTKRDSPRNRQ